jgi:hypothetical protein
MVIRPFHNLLGNQKHFDIDTDNLCDPKFVKKPLHGDFFLKHNNRPTLVGAIYYGNFVM